MYQILKLIFVLFIPLIRIHTIVQILKKKNNRVKHQGQKKL